jgi:hypothetical protein
MFVTRRRELREYLKSRNIKVLDEESDTEPEENSEE